MKKLNRVLALALTLALIALPQVALGASTPNAEDDVTTGYYTGTIFDAGIEIPLTEKQTHYPIRLFSSGSSAGTIISVSQTPTQSGNTLYPKVEVVIVGSATYQIDVRLEVKVGNNWQHHSTVRKIGQMTTSLSFNPSFTPARNNTYRFVIDVVTNSQVVDSFTMYGNAFTF